MAVAEVFLALRMTGAALCFAGLAFPLVGYPVGWVAFPAGLLVLAIRPVLIALAGLLPYPTEQEERRKACYSEGFYYSQRDRE